MKMIWRTVLATAIVGAISIPSASASVVLDFLEPHGVPGSPFVADSTGNAELDVDLAFHLVPDAPPPQLDGFFIESSSAFFTGGTVGVSFQGLGPGGIIFVSPITFDVGIGGTSRSFSQPQEFPTGHYKSFYNLTSVTYTDVYMVAACNDPFTCGTPVPVPFAMQASDIYSDNFTVASAATPLPAALPLFATGLSGLGLLGWRRKRKNAASIAAA